MASIAGIEIGPDYCVLLRARHRASGLEVGSVRLIEGADWPAEPAARSRLLQTIREELGLPRRATVVAWRRAAFSAASGEAMLRQAGFTIETILSPSDALALVAWSRRPLAGAGPSAWLSINRHGAAISVVHDLEVLYSREFDWRIRASDQRVQANVLRRYLYIAQLVPEVRRAAAVVRDTYRRQLELAVACGNIPDLRSFTMPLIDQLDIEFETLDSLDGLLVSDELAATLVREAPALRLAAAAASNSRSPTLSFDARRLPGIAAGVILLAGATWGAFQLLPDRSRDRPSEDQRIVSTQGREAPPVPATSEAGESPPVTQPPSPTTGVVASPTVSRTSRTPARSGEGPSASPGQGLATGSEQGVAAMTVLPPLPAVTGILISSDRRLAVIEGSVVGIGARVAGRTVARILADAVVLREPTGREVRVAVRAQRQE